MSPLTSAKLWAWPEQEKLLGFINLWFLGRVSFEPGLLLMGPLRTKVGGPPPRRGAGEKAGTRKQPLGHFSRFLSLVHIKWSLLVASNWAQLVEANAVLLWDNAFDCGVCSLSNLIYCSSFAKWSFTMLHLMNTQLGQRLSPPLLALWLLSSCDSLWKEAGWEVEERGPWGQTHSPLASAPGQWAPWIRVPSLGLLSHLQNDNHKNVSWTGE